MRDFDHLERLLLDQLYVGPVLSELSWRPLQLLAKNVRTEKMARLRYMELDEKKRRHTELLRSMSLMSASHMRDCSIVLFDDVVGTHTTFDACIELLSQLEPRAIYTVALFRREGASIG
jgi:predicted amidophosphoribosyltransferase